ncbi:MAG: hypothetical protein NZ959_10940 [Armatimonadetes bacterium]|nr:hypothetical protein [Armatimonadota bacterium]MDW8122885.1 hypothetical protein [Armatimonadota bacterium]
MKVGVATATLVADKEMVIAGGIHPVFVNDQEGELRATAFVLESHDLQVAIVSCDILMISQQDLADPLREIEDTYAIPSSHILVTCTHTHHAPSTVKVHGYDKDQTFVKRVQRAIVEAVGKAQKNARSSADDRMMYWLGLESSVGQNSRLLLSDGTIYWVGPRDDAIRPTGPFDGELPVLTIADEKGRLKGVLFSHACHNIGTIKGAVRSPSFYGLAAQELESKLGAVAAYLPGAAGSSHNLSLPTQEAVHRIKSAVKDALRRAPTIRSEPIQAVKKPFTYRIRHFNDDAEEEQVSYYCTKRIGKGAEKTIEVFRQMRQSLSSEQGKERTTELQAMRLGDIALIALPGEVFTILGWEIKRRSPFRNTIVVSLANDWIGYLPDEEGFDLGGYQVWTGFHSFVEKGTGERMVAEAVRLLEELANPLTQPFSDNDRERS